jgi:hypothetical protein
MNLAVLTGGVVGGLRTEDGIVGILVGSSLAMG